MNESRREIMRAFVVALSCAPSHALFAKDLSAVAGNFDYIYADPTLREEFKKFLVNVFHLYPQDDLHALILEAVKRHRTDAAVYRQVQSQLGSIKPFIGDITYSIPALAKQKRVLAEQTVSLIDAERRYDGYLEIGSNGRFLDALEERLEIEGDCFTMSDRAPTKSPTDIVDRGQFRRAGTFIALNDYRPDLLRQVPAHSVDLACIWTCAS